MLILARELTAEVASLVKEIDSAIKGQKNARGFLVLLDGATKANTQKLAEFAAKEKISMPLSINKKGKTPPYPLSAEANVGAIVYKGKKAVESFAFKKPTKADLKSVVDAAKKNIGSGA